MDISPPRSWFSSLQAAAAVLLLAPALALPWCWLAYSRSHLERQGIDIVNHLTIAEEVAAPGGPTERVLGDHYRYPSASHRLVAWSAPLFGGRLLPALRYAATMSVVALLLLPYVLLCRLFRPLPALVLLLAWHLASFFLKVDGVNHYLWEGQYNYSRAVGTVAFWLALVALSTEARSAWGRLAVQGLATACACAALACHIAPGAVAFGAVLAWQGACLLRRPRWEHAVGAAVALLAAAAMLFGTDVWVYMARNAHDNGWLPVGNHYLLLVWVPTLLVALGLYFARLRSAEPEGGGDAVETALAAGLLASGALQAYLTYRMLTSGAAAPYAIKSLYFFTFPLAALLLIRWAGRWASRRPWPALAGVPAWAPVMLAVALGATFAYRVAKGDAGLRHQTRFARDGERRLPPRGQLPDEVARSLRASGGEFAGWYYYDPYQVFGSYYATLVALGAERGAAMTVLEQFHKGDGTVTPAAQAELTRAGFAGVLLPGDADPARLAPGLGRPVKAGRFWKCPVPAALSAATP